MMTDRTTADRQDWPSKRDQALTGLEIFLTGTPAELDAAARVLGQIGRIMYASPRRRMVGPEASRSRVYVRLHVATAAPATPVSMRTDDDLPTLPDLAA
jgi:hypothetical protein